jgi:Tol biopolymer transport system component
MIAFAAFLFFAVPSGTLQAPSGFDLFQRALVIERLEGKLDEALELYERILREFPEESGLRVRVLVELGRCYELKRREAEAVRAYEQVVLNHGEFEAQVEIARRRLAELRKRARPTASAAKLARQIWSGPDVDTEGAPSPDGRYLSYVDWDTGNLAVYEIASGQRRPLSQKKTYDESPEFALNSVVSPTGKEIAYTWLSQDLGYELRVVGSDGSGARTLHRNQKTEYIHPQDWSRDGENILALVYRSDGSRAVNLLSVADGSARELKRLEDDSPWKMSLSPDGRYVAYDFPQEGGVPERDIALLATDGSGESVLVEHPANDTFPLWAPDGKRLLFMSDRTGELGLWIAGVSEGEPKGSPEILFHDIGRSFPIGITRDGSFYYSLQTGMRDVYVASLEPETGKLAFAPEPLTPRFIGSKTDPDWSPDGEFLSYVSERGRSSPYRGNRVITIRSLSNGKERTLTPDVSYWWTPRWSPDGSFLRIHGQDQDGGEGLYQLDLESERTIPIYRSESGYLYMPVWSSDGKAVYFRRNAEGFHSIVALDLESGHASELYRVTLSSNIQHLDLSPNDREIAFVSGEGDGRAILAVSPVAGEPRTILPLPAGTRITTLAWSRDGRYIYLGRIGPEVQEGKAELWRVTARGGSPEPLGVSMEGLRALRFHPDGQRIAFAAGEYSEEVWVLENFLPPLKEGAGK